jgi:4-amino-4-deoxy-L-arabinose transferase-like glycosyltransferase
LTKGPVGIVIPALIIFLYAVISRETKRLFNLHCLLGAVLFCAIAFPWYIAECAVHGWAYFRYFFLEHNIQRFATENLPHVQPLYFYIPIVVGGFFPWILFVPLGLVKLIKNRKKKQEEAGRRDHFGLFLVIWWSVVIIFFSLSRSKIPTYILSAFVPMGFLAGRFFMDFDVGKRSDIVLVKIFAVITGIAAVTFFVGTQIFYSVMNSSPGILNWIILYSIFAVFLCVFTFNLKHKKWKMIPELYIVFVLMVSMTIQQEIYLRINQRRSLKDLAHVYKKISGDKDIPLGFYVLNKPSMVFYSQKNIKKLEWLGDFESFMRDNDTAICVMRENEFWVLYNEYHQLPLYVIEKKAKFVLVANRLLKTGNQF